ncbi:MAG: (d)CMP kinase [Clostridia bacterium]
MLNIAIDGPCGAGKSTISKLVAKKLGITYLDTGAMYRAVALFVTRNGADVHDKKTVVSLLKNIEINFVAIDDQKHIFLNGEDVEKQIREHSMSKLASDVSKIEEVRLFLVEKQREIAQNSNVVLDGRDITSFVLPNAKFKFYLTATAQERAKRRFEELKSKGGCQFCYDEILRDVIDRDKNDMERKFAPLVQTKDAILIDSTDMTIQEIVDYIVRKVEENK